MLSLANAFDEKDLINFEKLKNFNDSKVNKLSNNPNKSLSVRYAMSDNKHFNKIMNINNDKSSLSKETKETKNNNYYSSLDFDNFKKRTEKDRENQLLGSLSVILTGLFPLIDNFEIAIKQEDKPKELEALYKLVLTFLENLNITEVPGVGEAFDPSYHEAVEHSGEGENQIVEEVLRKGYKLEDRLIRPAMVKVQSE